MRRALAALAPALLALAGCGGGASAEDVLRETSERMADIRSATLSMRLTLEGLERAEESRLGFALEGPIALDGDGGPEARLRYTQIAGGEQEEATFVATGGEAFAEVGGAAYRLPDDRAASLREAARQVGGDGAGLPIDAWIRDAEVTSEGDADRVNAELDAGVALRDIFAAVRATGADAPEIDDAGASELREAVDEARLVLWTGAEDRLLRRLEVRVGFSAEVPERLRDDIGELVGGRLAFDVALADVNRPVEVDPPADPQPAPAG